MHDRDGRYPSHGLAEGVARNVRVGSPRLDPEKRRHSLEVVLHPMVNLTDRGIFCDEFALLVPHLCHIAAQHDRTNPFTLVADGDRAQRHRYSARLDVGTPWCPAGYHERQGFVDGQLAADETGCDLGERFGLELVREADAVKRRQCIGACEGHQSINIEPDQAVGCAWCTPARPARCAQVREVARGDHREQVVRAFVERHLLAARGAGLAQVGVTGDHGDRLVCGLVAGGCQPAKNWHSAHPRRGFFVPVGSGRVDDAHGLE